MSSPDARHLHSLLQRHRPLPAAETLAASKLQLTPQQYVLMRALQEAYWRVGLLKPDDAAAEWLTVSHGSIARSAPPFALQAPMEFAAQIASQSSVDPQVRASLTRLQHIANVHSLPAKASDARLRCACCFRPGDQQCSRCLRVVYCSRDCQKADWAMHKSGCGKPKALLPPASPDSPSIVASKLPASLLGHSLSFLSYHQIGQSACVNHAWRNASLLPSASSHEPHAIRDAADPAITRASNARTLLWGKDSPLFFWNLPPWLPQRLLTLTISVDVRPHSLLIGAWTATLPASLLSLTIPLLPADAAEALVQATPRLTSLRVVWAGIELAAIQRLGQLQHLRAISLPCATAEAVEADQEHAASFYRDMLRTLAECMMLRELEFTSTSRTEQSNFTPLSLAALLSDSAPVFRSLERLVMGYFVKEPDPITHLASLGAHFPVLTELTLSLYLPEQWDAPCAKAMWNSARWRDLFAQSLRAGLAPLRLTMRRFEFLAVRAGLTNQISPVELSRRCDRSPWTENALPASFIETIASQLPEARVIRMHSLRAGRESSILELAALQSLCRLCPKLEALTLHMSGLCEQLRIAEQLPLRTLSILVGVISGSSKRSFPCMLPSRLPLLVELDVHNALEVLPQVDFSALLPADTVHLHGVIMNFAQLAILSCHLPLFFSTNPQGWWTVRSLTNTHVFERTDHFIDCTNGISSSIRDAFQQATLSSEQLNWAPTHLSCLNSRLMSTASLADMHLKVLFHNRVYRIADEMRIAQLTWLKEIRFEG
jgi:hypothetical protein